MKFNLYENPITQLSFERRIIRLNTAFFRVLQCYVILQDEFISQYEQVEMCLRLLVRNKYTLLFLPPNKKIHLFKLIFESFIDTGGNTKDAVKSFDFEQDASFIYASFLQCYGIDLMGKDRNLHWWKFIALFSGLTDDTRIMQVISIRTKPMPKATKYNAEERRQLARLKAIYRLKVTETEREKQLAEGYIKMAKALEGMIRE